MVGIRGAVLLPASVYSSLKLRTFSSTLGARLEQNLYSGELAVIEYTLSTLLMLRYSSIVLLINNKAAILTLRQP
jgi:hypothetical protein